MATQIYKQVLSELLTVPRCQAVGCGIRSRYISEYHLCSNCEQKSSIKMISHKEMTREELYMELADIKESLYHAESGFERAMIRDRQAACYDALHNALTQ